MNATNTIHAEARRLGFTLIRRTRGGHWVYRLSGKGQVTVSHTPGDERGIRNAIGDLRRVAR